MALADFGAYKAKMALPDEVIDFVVTHGIGSGSGWSSNFTNTSRAWNGEVTTAAAVKPGATPALCDRTTPGAMGQRNAPAGLQNRVWLNNLTTNTEQTLMLVDRLAHVAGLIPTNTGVQTIDFPPLTRYATDPRVFAAVEIYTIVGATPTTIVMNYTNQDGAAKTSPPNAIGGTGAREVARILPFTLAAGDTGVRDVASIQLAASLVSGEFGITLYRPLLQIPLNPTGDYLNSGDPLRELSMQMPLVLDDACLQFMVFATGVFTPVMSGDVNFMWV